jgi:hypothetical protein
MASQGQVLLEELAKKVDDFVYDHNIYPNAILLSVAEITTLTEVDRLEIKDKLPTIVSLIPIDCDLPIDLPLPVLLPTIATKIQRERTANIEKKDL